MPYISSEDSLAALFPRGTILWRTCDVFHMGDAVSISPREFRFMAARNSERSVLAKISLGSVSIDEPVVVPMLDDYGKQNDGILLFVEDEPPSDWTHMVVTTTSMALRTSMAKERKGAVNAKYGCGLAMEDYLQFRKDLMEQGLGQDPDEPFEEKVLRAKRCIAGTGAGTGLARCVIDGLARMPMAYCGFQDHRNDQIEKEGERWDSQVSTGTDV